MVTDLRQSITAEGHETNDVLPISVLLRILWKWLWVIVLVALVVTGAVVGVSLSQTPRYVASVKILVGQDQELIETPQDYLALQSLAPTMAEAIDSRRTAKAVVQQLDLQTSSEYIVANLSAEQIPETQFIEVSYQDTDPEKAARIANTVGKVFSDQISEVSSDSKAVTATVTATVWDQAMVPDAPATPNPVRNGLLALVLGSMLGVGLAFLLEYLDDRWQSPEEAEQVSGVPTFGVIPEFEVPKSKQRRKGNIKAGTPG